MARLSSSGYLKSVGMLEFVSSSLLQNQKKTPNKIIPRSAEEYQEQILELKKKNRELDCEISILKFKVRHGDDELAKKQKIINDLSNAKGLETFNKSGLDSITVISNLKCKLSKIEEKYKEKQAALIKLQKDIKSTHVEEMNIMIETLKNELQRLTQVALKGKKSTNIRSSDKAFRQNKQHSLSKSSETRIKELTSTILMISSDKNRLMLENKSLKIDLQKSLETQENMKKNFEINLKKAEQSTILPGVSERLESADDLSPANTALKSNHDPKILEKYHEKENELKSEVERLMKVIVKIKEERNLYREKCFVMEKRMGVQNTNNDSGSDFLSYMKTKKVPIVALNENCQKQENPFFHEDDANFLQSLIRNHKARYDNLYGSNVVRALNHLDSTIEAIDLIQAIARNTKMLQGISLDG